MLDMNYCENINIHNFADSMTISECALETVMAIENDWSLIESTIDISPEDSLFEAEILGIQEAEGEKKGFKETLVSLAKSVIDMLKKIASYIMGMVSKWLIAIDQLIKKDAGIAKDKARIIRGVERLAKNDKSLKIYGLLCQADPTKNIKFTEAQYYLADAFGFNNEGKIFALDKAGVDDLSNKIASEGDVIRGKIVGEASVAANDFAKVIIKKMTGVEAPQEYEFKGKDQLTKAMNDALATIKDAKEQKKAVKTEYESVKKVINEWIKDIHKLSTKANGLGDEKKPVAIAAIKVAGKLYKTAGSICAAAQSRVLNVLSADYRMNSQLIVKLYAAGGTEGSVKKDEKKAQKQAAEEYAANGAAVDENANVSTTQESVESIFGMDLI